VRLADLARAFPTKTSFEGSRCELTQTIELPASRVNVRSSIDIIVHEIIVFSATLLRMSEGKSFGVTHNQIFFLPLSLMFSFYCECHRPLNPWSNVLSPCLPSSFCSIEMKVITHEIVSKAFALNPLPLVPLVSSPNRRREDCLQKKIRREK